MTRMDEMSASDRHGALARAADLPADPFYVLTIYPNDDDPRPGSLFTSPPRERARCSNEASQTASWPPRIAWEVTILAPSGDIVGRAAATASR